MSKALPRGLKTILKKGGHNYSSIINNWSSLVGKKIASICYPKSIKTGKELRDGILFLNVTHGDQLLVEYSKKDIMDKMNSFFGYSVVEKLKFTYFDDRKDFSTEESKKKINATNNKFKKKIDDIKNEKIKKSLVEFTKVFREK